MRLPVKSVLSAVALVVAIGLVVVVVTIRGGERQVPVPVAKPETLAESITAFLATQSAEQPYRDPTPEERLTAATALDDHDKFLEFGFTQREGVDNGRPYQIFASPQDDRAWGMIVVDRSQPIRVAVEVPHPRTDMGTEWIGLDLFRAVPGSVLLIAGANRRAAGELADVAHNENSFYQALSVALAGKGIPQMQLHGFADLNLPDHDIAVSTGADAPNAAATRIADALAGAGFDECRAWEERCGRLEGTTNVQGKAAAARGAAFVHVELSNKIRTDEEKRTDLVTALAGAV